MKIEATQALCELIFLITPIKNLRQGYGLVEETEEGETNNINICNNAFIYLVS